jgi:hypothetical protein
VARYSGLGPAGTAPFSPVFLSQPDPSPRAPCSVSLVTDPQPVPVACVSLLHSARPPPHLFPVFEPFSILFLIIKQAQASSTLRHCHCAASSGDKAPRPFPASEKPSNGCVHTSSRSPSSPPHPGPLEAIGNQVFPTAVGSAALPPPHGSPSSSKLPAATPSDSPRSPCESRRLTQAGQPELPSRCRSTMEAGAISSSELLCRPRCTLVLHECGRAAAELT